MNILVDAFGGDNAPDEIVKGVLVALYKHPTLQITLVGKQDKIESLLAEKSYDHERLTIIPATEVIDCDEAPVNAIRTKKDSSLVVALDKLKTGEFDGMVSAGSTGAVLSGAVLKLGRLQHVSRPALAPLLPTQNGGRVLLIDCGANMDCKPINLCHFALMGSTFMKTMFGIETPRVALLSVGVESAKGNQLVLETYPMLQKMDINFVGNMEARDALSGDYDVIVTDGFGGNILLKGMEGSAKMLLGAMKGAMLSSFKSKMGALLLKKSLKAQLKKFDYEQYGGSPLLGTKQLVVKAHGSSKAKQIVSAIEQVMGFAQNHLLDRLGEALSNFKSDESNEQTLEQTPVEQVQSTTSNQVD